MQHFSASVSSSSIMSCTNYLINVASRLTRNHLQTNSYLLCMYIYIYIYIYIGIRMLLLILGSYSSLSAPRIVTVMVSILLSTVCH